MSSPRLASSLLLALALAGRALAQPPSRACTPFNSTTDAIDDLVVSPSTTGSSVVSWSFPPEVCIDSFVVAATPLDSYGKVSGDTSYFTTMLQSTPVPELQVATPYRFEVQVKLAGGSGDGPKASTIATPFVGCTKPDAAGGQEGVTNATTSTPPPGRIGTLTVLQDEEGFNLNGETATLCWTAPTDGTCVEEYTLGRRMQARNDAEAFNEDFQWQFFTFQEAGCHEIDGHQAGRTYDYGIRGAARVQKGNETETLSGEVTAAQVFFADSWQCLRGGTGYELCAAGANRQCAPFDCDGINDMGLCGAPFVRKYDIDRKIIVQYCSETCSCEVPEAGELARVAALREVASGTLVSEDFACCNRWGEDE